MPVENGINQNISHINFVEISKIFPMFLKTKINIEEMKNVDSNSAKEWHFVLVESP